MVQKEINKIHELFLKHYNIDFNLNSLNAEYPNFKNQNKYELEDYINNLIDSGGIAHLTYLKNSFSRKEILFFLNNLHYPIIVFPKTTSKISAVVLEDVDGKIYSNEFTEKLNMRHEITNLNDYIDALLHDPFSKNNTAENKDEDILVITCYPYESYYTRNTNNDTNEENYKNSLTPVQRLFKLFAAEKKEISYIYLYAFLASIFSLALPLGVQAIIGIVSSGQIPTSVIVLIGFIIASILVTGGIQLMQIHMVEHIQQKLFVKTAFEFAYRIPKLKIESVLKYYPPELMNRFFDIITLQKGLAKILVEFTAAFIQIILGLLLLTFYHSSFIIFGSLIIIIMILIIRFTAAKGLKTSLYESKYKYQLANWLEEIARALSTFKLAGYSTLPMTKTDYFASHYLHSRKSHFKILVIQYISFIFFKTFITGGLLILGCVLLINKEINIGQFVASEIVIILVMNAVEKFIVQLDTVYDVLTSLEKIGSVMDLPIENPTGINIERMDDRKSLCIEVKNLKYKYPAETEYLIKDISLKIEHEERICLSGYSTSGKTTFINILLGFLTSYEGVLTVNGISMRELNKNSVINQVGDNISQEDLFDGTILENITLGRNGITMDDVLNSIACVGLNDFVNSLEQGINTHLLGGNMGISESVARKIIIARSIANNPKLLILEDFLLGLEQEQKINLMKYILKKEHKWTVILISNDEDIMKLCDRTVIMKEGKIVWKGNYDDTTKNEHFSKIV